MHSPIQGTVYEEIGKAPADKRQQALESMMKTMAAIHAVHWHPKHKRELYLPHKTTQSFWEEEVCGATKLVFVHGISVAAISMLKQVLYTINTHNYCALYHVFQLI